MKRFQTEIDSLREKRIDALASRLAAVEVTIAAFRVNDPQYVEYADRLRAEMAAYKSRLGSETVHIEELKLLKEVRKAGISLVDSAGCKI